MNVYIELNYDADWKMIYDVFIISTLMVEKNIPKLDIINFLYDIYEPLFELEPEMCDEIVYAFYDTVVSGSDLIAIGECRHALAYDIVLRTFKNIPIKDILEYNIESDKNVEKFLISIGAKK